MKQVLRLTGMDDMLIGPFDTAEAAQRWFATSIFAGEPCEFENLIEPRPDHRKTSGPRPRRTEYSPAKNALMDMAEHFITLDPASKPGLRRMLDNYRVANVRGLAESDIAAFQTAMVEFAKSRGITVGRFVLDRTDPAMIKKPRRQGEP